MPAMAEPASRVWPGESDEEHDDGEGNRDAGDIHERTKCVLGLYRSELLRLLGHREEHPDLRAVPMTNVRRGRSVVNVTGW